jgi:hypothetical protein
VPSAKSASAFERELLFFEGTAISEKLEYYKRNYKYVATTVFVKRIFCCYMHNMFV